MLSEDLESCCSKIIKGLINEDMNIFQDMYIHTLKGIPALLLAIGEISKIDKQEEWDKISYYYIKELNSKLSSRKVNISVFAGLSGIGYSILSNSENKTKYTKFLSQLNAKIMYGVKKQIISSSPNMSNMECMGGLCGVGRYLLNYKNEEVVLQSIKEILTYTVEFMKLSEINGIKILGGICKIEDDGGKEVIGYNLGMAHGISGILSFLSISLINGVEVRNQKTTIQNIMQFLYRYKFSNEKSSFFPSDVTLEEYINKSKPELYISRTWCNGITGISRSIYLASKAIDDSMIKRDAINMILSTVKEAKMDIENLGLISPTFCHGYSGYLSILNNFYIDEPELEDSEIVSIITKKIFAFYEKENIYGFSSYEILEGVEGVEKVNSIEAQIGTVSVLLPLIQLKNNKLQEWNGIYLTN